MTVTANVFGHSTIGCCHSTIGCECSAALPFRGNDFGFDSVVIVVVIECKMTECKMTECKMIEFNAFSCVHVRIWLC